MSDYSNIDNPYSDQLSRSADLALVAGPTPDEMAQQSDYSGGTAGGTDQTTGAMGSSDTGAVETTAVKSSGAISDLWIDTFIKSTNWKPRSSGFYIDGATGYAEFSNIYISGAITAISGGTIGGWTVSPAELYNGNVHLKSTAEQVLMGSATAPGTGTGVFLGKDGTDYEFRAGNPSGAYMWWNGSQLTVNGPVIYTPLIATALASGSILNIQGWQFSGTFSVTDADTVAWTSGTLSFADGQSFSINSGNTGNMSARTYIYFDTGTSTTAFQTTTSASTPVGANKVLVAVAKNGTGEATYQVMNDNQVNIDASSIVANSITANELSTTLTYSGAIIIDTGGYIRSGQTAFDTGTGWWIGDASGTPKFSIGNAGSDKLAWDGTNLEVKGRIKNIATRVHTDFGSSGRISQSSSGMSTYSFGTSGMQMTTAAGATSYAKSTWFISQKVFANNPIITIRMELNMASTAKGEFFFGFGDLTTATTGHTFTSNHAGIYGFMGSNVLNIYYSTYDGTLNQNAAASSISLAASGKVLDIALVLTSDSKLEIYTRYDNASSWGYTSTSSNIPSSSTSMNKIQYSAVCNDVSGSGGGWGIIWIGSSYES